MNPALSRSFRLSSRVDWSCRAFQSVASVPVGGVRPFHERARPTRHHHQSSSVARPSNARASHDPHAWRAPRDDLDEQLAAPALLPSPPQSFPSRCQSCDRPRSVTADRVHPP